MFAKRRSLRRGRSGLFSPLTRRDSSRRALAQVKDYSFSSGPVLSPSLSSLAPPIRHIETNRLFNGVSLA